MSYRERHRVDRIGWLRAAVLGANDGIVSTASLLVGVAASGADRAAIGTVGVAGLVAGAMSMAAGEYVSVSSQADTERADTALEVFELASNATGEREELATIYRARGLDAALAQQVADQLTTSDALSAHLRDELGLTPHQRARPLQASLASAATFAVGALLPLGVAWLAPARQLALLVTGCSLVFLMLLGGIAARTGGAKALTGAMRVGFWGAFAMGLTYLVGRLFDAPI